MSDERIIVEIQYPHVGSRDRFEKARVGQDTCKINGVQFTLIAVDYPPYTETWSATALEKLRMRGSWDE
jgi:hypothetical protein